MITTEQIKGISSGDRPHSIGAIAAGTSVTPHVPWYRRLRWFGPRGIAILATASIAANLVLRYLVGSAEMVWQAPLIAALLVGGLHAWVGADHRKSGSFRGIRNHLTSHHLS